MEAIVTRVEVARHIAADPASVALLLAEPPNETEPDHGWLVAPPRRAGVGFISVVEASPLSGLVASGEVTVEPSTDAGCEVRLVLTTASDAPPPRVERSASKFLSLLAVRARSRSRAA